ncbi:MAG TPA: MEDS domain-containing protein [Steroidobacter sp.]|uniref:MEDS domain-containing protein n=1 Tax=Steroidobacter sp. TaxID=1978227 RepID=UPI002EDBB1FF
MNWFGNALAVANGIALEEITPGAHLCSTGKSDQEQIEIAVAFLAQGLQRGDKCVYIGDDGARSAIIQQLGIRGVDVERMMRSRALLLNTPADLGLRGDATDVYRVFTFWKRMTEASVKEHFQGLRGASQMTWLSADVTVQQLRAYEERLAQLAQDTGCVLLCQYDQRQQPPAFLLESIGAHALVIDHGQVCRNVYCAHDEETNETSLEARALELLLQGLRSHEQSRRELADTQAELARLARIITLGELTASVAHEVAQPVAAMIADGNAALRWLANTPPQLEETRLSLVRIIAGGHRAESVIQRIRSLVKKADSSQELLDIGEVIIEVAALMRDRLQQASIVLRTDLSVSLPRTWAHRVQIQQVVFNLVVNALEAINARAGDEREIHIRAEQGPRYVTVSVTDSGIGLGTDQVPFVPRPFYTTKPHGMGIGLSISSRIIEAHAGRLWAERNASGAGATFYFTLPLPRAEHSS